MGWYDPPRIFPQQMRDVLRSIILISLFCLGISINARATATLPTIIPLPTAEEKAARKQEKDMFRKKKRRQAVLPGEIQATIARGPTVRANLDYLENSYDSFVSMSSDQKLPLKQDEVAPRTLIKGNDNLLDSFMMILDTLGAYKANVPTELEAAWEFLSDKTSEGTEIAPITESFDYLNFKTTNSFFDVAAEHFLTKTAPILGYVDWNRNNGEKPILQIIVIDLVQKTKSGWLVVGRDSKGGARFALTPKRGQSPQYRTPRHYNEDYAAFLERRKAVFYPKFGYLVKKIHVIEEDLKNALPPSLLDITQAAEDSGFPEINVSGMSASSDFDFSMQLEIANLNVAIDNAVKRHCPDEQQKETVKSYLEDLYAPLKKAFDPAKSDANTNLIEALVAYLASWQGVPKQDVIAMAQDILAPRPWMDVVSKANAFGKVTQEN